MKTDLATSIAMALFGAIVAFVICNMFFGEIQDVSFKTISGNVDTSLLTPDEEIFNYKALNPTVEVYVGDCETDPYGNCIESGV